MKTPLRSVPSLELAFVMQEVSPEVHRAELRQWTVYLPDLLPALLQAMGDD